MLPGMKYQKYMWQSAESQSPENKDSIRTLEFPEIRDNIELFGDLKVKAIFV